MGFNSGFKGLICFSHKAKYQAPVFSIIFNNFHFNILNPKFQGHFEMLMFLEVRVRKFPFHKHFKIYSCSWKVVHSGSIHFLIYCIRSGKAIEKNKLFLSS